MATGGQKRTRSERVAALELPPGRWERAWANLRRRDVLLRIGLCVLTALVLCVVIRGWDPPFAYRTDYTPSHDIAARAPFELPDPKETEKARDRARWQVRYIYALDPEPLVRLRLALRNTVLEVMAASTYADRDRRVWADFQPPTEGKRKPPGAELQRRFKRFHDALAGDEDLARFEKAVAAALEPFEQRGLLEKLQQEPGQGNQEEIVVYPVDRPDARRVVKVSDVLIGKGTAIRESLQNQFSTPDLADPVFEWIRRQPKDTLELNRNATNEALEAAAKDVEPVVDQYKPGKTIAGAGQALGAEDIRVLRKEYEAVLGRRSIAARLCRATAVTAIILALFALCALYLHYHQRRVIVSLKRLGTMLVVVVLTVGLSCLASADGLRAEIIPLLLFGQTMAIAYRRELALLLLGVVTLILVLAVGQGLGGFMLLMGVAATAVLQLGRIRSRTKLIHVGFVAAVVAVLLTISTGVVGGQPVDRALLTAAALGGLWTLAAGFLMTGLLPFIERLFGVLTDISLLELGDVSHPLLQELVRRAPSTYNHSFTVGSIAEAAAEAIGARGVLVRVGAYFHDIGKMLKPGYFIENQPPDANRHEDLAPAMSTLVIIAHIKDGADLARQHHLPEPIIDFIEQHHGTTLVEFFYERASAQSQSDPNGGEVEKSAFRYPGPRPQTKEASVLMLADAVESASRSLVDPTPARIESIVRQVSERRLRDAQFDESGLTLRELRTIENSMIKSLIAMYHGRVKYPDQRTA